MNKKITYFIICVALVIVFGLSVGLPIILINKDNNSKKPPNHDNDMTFTEAKILFNTVWADLTFITPEEYKENTGLDYISNSTNPLSLNYETIEQQQFETELAEVLDYFCKYFYLQVPVNIPFIAINDAELSEDTIYTSNVAEDTDTKSNADVYYTINGNTLDFWQCQYENDNLYCEDIYKYIQRFTITKGETYYDWHVKSSGLNFGYDNYLIWEATLEKTSDGTITLFESNKATILERKTSTSLDNIVDISIQQYHSDGYKKLMVQDIDEIENDQDKIDFTNNLYDFIKDVTEEFFDVENKTESNFLELTVDYIKSKSQIFFLVIKSLEQSKMAKSTGTKTRKWNYNSKKWRNLHFFC